MVKNDEKEEGDDYSDSEEDREKQKGGRERRAEVNIREREVQRIFLVIYIFAIFVTGIRKDTHLGDRDKKRQHKGI